jgi:tRNA(Ile)-lysidine synthase TilS/MesJ
MKKLSPTGDLEKSSYGDRYCVTVEFADPRISGTLTIGAMATPDYIRYQGTVIVNGVEYRVSNNCAVNVSKIEHYALTKNGTFSEYASNSARETFRKALAEIVAVVLKDKNFVNEQIATETQHLGYDIERLQSNRDALTVKIAELNEEISQKMSKQWTNKALLGGTKNESRSNSLTAIG